MDLLNKLNVLRQNGGDNDDEDKDDVNNEEIISIHPFFIKFYDKRIEKIYKQSIVGLLRNETLFRDKVLIIVYFIVFTIISIAQFFSKSKGKRNDTILVWSRYGLTVIVLLFYGGFIIGAHKKPNLVFGVGKDKKTLNKFFILISASFELLISLFPAICSPLFSDKSSIFYSTTFIIVCSLLRVYNSALNWKYHAIYTILLLGGVFTFEVINMTNGLKKIIIWAILFWLAMFLVYLYAVRKVEIWRRFFNVLLIFFNNKNALAHHNEKIYYSFLKKIFPFFSLPRALKKSTYSKVFLYEERTRRAEEQTYKEDTTEDDENKENDDEKDTTAKNKSDSTSTTISISTIAESSIQNDPIDLNDNNDQQSISMSLLSQKEENSIDDNEFNQVILTEKDTNENTILGVVNFDLVVVEGGSKRRSSWHKEYIESLQRTFAILYTAKKSLCKVFRVNGTTVYFIVDPTSQENTETSSTSELDTKEKKTKKQKRGFVTDKQRKLALNKVIELFKYLLENKTTMTENENTTLFKTFRVALVQGSLSGGIVDPRKPTLDIWGDTFNTAIKLLNNCPQDSIMISGRLARFVNKDYSLTSLKIDEKDIALVNSRIVELSEQSEIGKETENESCATLSYDDRDKKSVFFDDDTSDDEDATSSISSTEYSGSSSSIESPEEDIKPVNCTVAATDTEEEYLHTDINSEKCQISKEESEYKDVVIEIDKKEESKEDTNKKVYLDTTDEQRAFKIIQQDYDKGYYNYTKLLKRGALCTVKKHNIEEVKNIYIIDKFTLRYRNKNVENKWDVHYATVINQRSVSLVLLFFCFLTSFAACIYDNTFTSKNDNIVYTNFIAPFIWFVPLILSLPAICNCYHNLVKSFVILAAVVMDVIVFVYVKLDMYTQLPSILICSPIIIHFLSTLQFFSASVMSIVLMIFVISFSDECYNDNFYEYALLVLSIEVCCVSVHYAIERYQRDVFSMTQILKGEKNRLEFNKSIMKDLLGSNLKCKSVLDTVVSRADTNKIHDRFSITKPSYIFPKVSAFVLTIANFDQIVISSQDKIVLAVLKSVYKAFSENCKKYHIDYTSHFGGKFIGVCNMFSYTSTCSFNAVSCVLDTMSDVAKLNNKQYDSNEISKKQEKEPEEIYGKEQLPSIQLRAGICTGPLIGGTVYLDFHRFGVYGEALNTAFLLEEACTAGMCQVSISTWEETYSKFYYSNQSSVKPSGGKDTILTYMITPSSLTSADDGLSLLNASASSSTSSIDTGTSSGYSYQGTHK